MPPSKPILKALLLFLVVACIPLVWAILPKPRQISTPSLFPSPTRTATASVSIPFADPAIASAVNQALGWSLVRDSIQENSGVSYVEFPVISSGEFVTVTLSVNGVPVIDALIVYLPTKAGVTQMSIPVGFEKDNQYLYFDASLPSDSALQFTREQAIKAVRSVYPRGKAMSLTMFKYISLKGVDWAACARQEKDERFEAGCQLALEYNYFYPEAERLFISRIPSESDWMPVGWWFAPYYQDLRIPLP